MGQFMKPLNDDAFVLNALLTLRLRGSDTYARLLHNLFTEPDVVNAFDALLEHTRGQNLEEDIYGPVCVLLNAIMEAIALNAPRKTPHVAGFYHPSDILLNGDSLYARFKPDIVALEVDRGDLIYITEKAARKIYSAMRAALQLVIGGAEIKTARKQKGQILNYLVNMKLHRPDLATIHGFHLDKNNLILYSFTACGMVTSKSLDVASLQNWIAYVALAYKALDERDSALCAVAQEAFVRWDLTMDLEEDTIKIPLAQFQVGTVPGRATWVGFQVDEDAGDQFSTVVTRGYHTKPPVGFVKVSWQDTNGKFQEGRLLDRAHGFIDDRNDKPNRDTASWIPGLVRHLYYHRYDETKIRLSGGVQRVRELLWLGSIGQPLSQCESLEHLYKVMFDILGISLHMAERGVIHRDLSWFNMLCKPKHNPETLARCDKVDHRPCIDYILSDKNLEDCEPCALITDLDHSAIIKIIEAEGYVPRTERTGTPMFIALELSSRESMELHAAGALTPLVKLFERLQNGYPLVYARAFPTDKGEFLKNFRAVVDEETARNVRSASEDEPRSDLSTNPTEPNRLHHDAESVWWAMMWHMSRAAPVDAKGQHIEIPKATNSADLETLYDDHCNNLLNHVPGKEDFRSTRIAYPRRAIERMHPDIQPFALVLARIARYLCVPWNQYVDQGKKQGIVRRDHAHQAMRRLLLLAILELRGKKSTVPFSTIEPRRFHRQPLQDRFKSPEMIGLQRSGIVQEVVPPIAPAVLALTSAHKRSHEEAFHTSGAKGESPDEDSCGNDGDDPKDNDYKVESKTVKLTETKDGYDVTARPEEGSVFDWIDKFHLATLKWFGTGY